MAKWRNGTFQVTNLKLNKVVFKARLKGGLAIVNALVTQDDFEFFCIMHPMSGRLLGWLCCPTHFVQEIVDELLELHDWRSVGRDEGDLPPDAEAALVRFSSEHLFLRQLPDGLRDRVAMEACVMEHDAAEAA